MNCAQVRPYLEAYVDCELSPERILDVEGHLRTCEACQGEVELSRLVIETTRKSATDWKLPPGLAERLEAALDEECRKEEAREERSQPLRSRSIYAVAAAAAAVLALGWSQTHSPRSAPLSLSLAGSQPESYIDALLRHHSAPPTSSLRDASSVNDLEPELGMPVRPPNLERYGAHFEGASVFRVNSVQAASLYYRMGTRRVTFYVYDPERMPLHTVGNFQPRIVGDRAVLVGQRHGYSIATCERKGVGYAVAADLSDQESAELVAAVER